MQIVVFFLKSESEQSSIQVASKIALRYGSYGGPYENIFVPVHPDQRAKILQSEVSTSVVNTVFIRRFLSVVTQ